MTWLYAARIAAARSSGLSALISICGRAHHVALSGSRGTYQISQPGNCRSSSRRRSPCPTGSLPIHAQHAHPPAMCPTAKRAAIAFADARARRPRRPQPTGCARGSLQELIRLFDAPRPGVSDLFSGVWVPAGNPAADPRFVLGIFAGPQVFHSGASTVSAVPAPPRSAASQPAAASYPGPGSPGRTITVPRRELVPLALRAVSLATGRHDRNLGSQAPDLGPLGCRRRTLVPDPRTQPALIRRRWVR